MWVEVIFEMFDDKGYYVYHLLSEWVVLEEISYELEYLARLHGTSAASHSAALLLNKAVIQ